MRARALLAVPAIVALGLAGRYGTSGALSNFLGVACWAALVYVLVLLVRPRLRPLRAAGIAGAVSLAVELAQLTPGPAYLSSKHWFFALALGSTFDPNDLPAYAAGVLAAAAIHARA